MTDADPVAAPAPVDRPRVIVDCDPGLDDVAALALASATCDLVGVTTVAGNAPLGDCTRNALATLELLGVDVPVHAGADRPLIRPPRHADGVHGEDGLLGVEVPAPSRRAEPTSAVEYLIETTRGEEGLWLVPIGPLTNVALAVRADPGLADRLAGVSLMGGSLRTGNVTPVAEFNIWFDPDAAAIVFDAGAPIRMCGLDVTQQVLIDAAFAARVRDLGGPAPAFFGEVFSAYAASCEALTGHAAGAMHDPCAVAALVAPELFRFERLHLAVARTGLAAGMTVGDRRGGRRGTRDAPNADVAVDVDPERMRELIFAALSAASAP